MKLASKSKREILRYVKLLRKHLKQTKSELADMSDVFYAAVDARNVLEYELNRLENVWLGRLKEAEEMFILRTANLERHNEKLIDMLVHREMIRTFPPVIIKTNETKIIALERRLANLQTHIRTAAENLVKPL